MVARSLSNLPGPKWIFECGGLMQLPAEVAALGNRCLLVVGGDHLRESGVLKQLTYGLRAYGVEAKVFVVDSEPSPETVDEAVMSCQGSAAIDVVAAVGGGSVMDTGKAISAMVKSGRRIEPYLEVPWGGRQYDLEKVPFVAAPTTAGTGSEATENAVIGRVRPDGWKASLRHKSLVPDVAIVDPVAMESCPPAVRNACAFDALTHLLESFVATGATDASSRLAGDGLEAIGFAIRRICTGKEHTLTGWKALAYASSVGGVTLARAGLGIVHGLAPLLGAQAAVAHGLACATTLAAATRTNVEALRATRSNAARHGLAKYAAAGRRLVPKTFSGDAEAIDALLQQLECWTEELQIPRLGQLAVQPASLRGIASAAKLKNNPADLDQDQVLSILNRRF